MVKKFNFSRQTVRYYFEASFNELKNIVSSKNTVVITDDHLFSLYQKKFTDWKTIVIKAGEKYKVQATVDRIMEQLIALGADRQTTLIGVGGGVVTDITGYVASVFLRGVSFGFVPTTVLAMVDAAIGGKNGIDVGVYKNMAGTINQPLFLLYDVSFLKTLPDEEWRNGFAEIIKHAAIKDAAMFRQLEKGDIDLFKKKKALLQSLIQRNALLKTKVVQGDEFEKGERKLLNFGHTLGHAVENQYRLMHGEAVAIGMVFAAKLSAELLDFKQPSRITQLIEQYGLPTHIRFHQQKVFEVLKADKKKQGDAMNFILLEKIGKAVIQKIPLSTINSALQ